MKTAQDVQDSMELLLSDARGIYIPRDFLDFKNVCTEDGEEITDEYLLEALEELKNPDGEYYWESWEKVLNETYLKNSTTGVVFCLHQDGDLWAIPNKELRELNEEESERFWDSVIC